MCKIEYDTSPEIILSRLNKLEEAMKSGQITVNCETAAPKAANVKNNKVKKKEQIDEVKVQPVYEFNKDSKLNIDIVRKSWKDILEAFKARRLMVLFAALTTGEPVECKGGIIKVKYEEDFAFHKQRLEKEENRKVVEEVFSEVLKERVRITYIIEGKENFNKAPEQVLKDTFGEELVKIIDE